MYQQRTISKGCWNNWTSTCEKTHLDTHLPALAKINSRCITNLNVNCKTIHLMEDSAREKAGGVGLVKSSFILFCFLQCWGWNAGLVHATLSLPLLSYAPILDF
jgi:hypothetical protein